MERKMDLEQHIRRQMAWSRATFGPGERSEGVPDHIRKELAEIAAEPTADGRAREWVDVVILALDGLWRSMSADNWHHDDIPAGLIDMILAMQSRNETRDWPDWRTADPTKAIEHLR
jgi:hypothetical protein